MSNDEKLFYGIGEVAEIVQVKPYVLRYWESEFKKLNPQKSFTGQRTYRSKDIQVALTIKKLLYEDKYTIAGAIQRLTELETQGQLTPFLSPGAATTVAVPEVVVPTPEIMASVPSEPVASITPSTEQPQSTKSPLDEKKVRDLKTLLEATKKVLKKYNLS